MEVNPIILDLLFILFYFIFLKIRLFSIFASCIVSEVRCYKDYVFTFVYALDNFLKCLIFRGLGILHVA